MGRRRGGGALKVGVEEYLNRREQDMEAVWTGGTDKQIAGG